MQKMQTQEEGANCRGERRRHAKHHKVQIVLILPNECGTFELSVNDIGGMLLSTYRRDFRRSRKNRPACSRPL